ncbi:MAG TPA: hypothetical protein VH597_15410 [Verrucomicrobiae bacterium]|jgi:hypothetical protein|nr:hypothetical protein [Verrucomicrobiae bacterium]
MKTQNHFNRRGIDFDTPCYWVIERVEYPVLFFKHLAKLLPMGSVLYFEGGKISPAAAGLYAAHRAEFWTEVVQETVMPLPQMYHCAMSDELLKSLGEMAAGRPASDLFNYLKAYREAKLLFAWNDAYEGELCISDRVPEHSVERFCQAMGVSCRREKTTPPKPEAIEKVSLKSESLDDDDDPASDSWYQRARTWLTQN